MDLYHLFILKEYLTKLVGIHYPREIIALIMMINYKPSHINCGRSYTCLIKNNIYVWGANEHGQLGLGHKNDKNFPRRLVSTLNIKSISCGSDFMIASTYTSGELCSWGNNHNGELGLGSYEIRILPQKFILETNSKSDIKSICSGLGHTIVLLESGKCYSWGINGTGQLGLGHFESKNSPREIKFQVDIEAIACGCGHNIALSNSESNTCYVWGSNSFGQLGLGDKNNKNLPTILSFIDSVVSIGCGRGHTIVLTSNSDSSKIYVWGSNDRGQLGLEDTIDRCSPQELDLTNVISISCGTNHTLALTKSGVLYSWGSNSSGQLGLGPTSNKCIPHEIKFILPIKSVTCGWYHTMAISYNDEIYVWGDNIYGQLGLGDNKDRYEPCRLDFKF